MDYIAQHWLLILIAVIAAVAIAWYIFHAARRTRVTGDRRDVLDEGAAPAARNQALIDAAPAAAAATLPIDPGAGSLLPADPVLPAAVPVATTEDPAAPAGANDLHRIKGIGPRLVALLGEHGVTRVAQIAAWSETDIDRFDAALGRFQGRIRRDAWVEQARLLETGDSGAYAARFGNTN